MKRPNSYGYNYKLLTPHQNWIVKWVLIFILIILMYGIYGTLTTNRNTKDIYYVDDVEYIGDPQMLFKNISNTATELLELNTKLVINTTTLATVTPETEGEVYKLKLRNKLGCHNKDFTYKILQRGSYWVLTNYIRADHGEIGCEETITYTTHSDFTFLENVGPLLERWQAPLSIALHAPGTDFAKTIESIQYLRNCDDQKDLVRQFATFHVYFHADHMPKQIPTPNVVLQKKYECPDTLPFLNINDTERYTKSKSLTYPVNVGRNVARDAALTHFILASDIELYPSPNLPEKFLKMVAKMSDESLLKPSVYVLPIFEIMENSTMPDNKSDLTRMFYDNEVIFFHFKICKTCHLVPRAYEWINATEKQEMTVFHTAKRIGQYHHWEPIYIGTHFDPHYEERLNWEGKSDKMTQGYALCVLDYNFKILSNAFLIHKPGIKTIGEARRPKLEMATSNLIKKQLLPELKIMYGLRKGCTW